MVMDSNKDGGANAGAFGQHDTETSRWETLASRRYLRLRYISATRLQLCSLMGVVVLPHLSHFPVTSEAAMQLRFFELQT